MSPYLDLPTLPVTPAHRRNALATLALVACVTLAAIPALHGGVFFFAAFVPGFIGALCAIDLVIAALFIRHAAVSHRPSLLALGAGFACSGACALAYFAATAPGGHLGVLSGMQSASWIWVGWHLALPLSVFAYVILLQTKAVVRRVPVVPTIVATFVVSFLVACAVSIVSPALPPYEIAGVWQPIVYAGALPLLAIAILAALLALVRRGFVAMLDAWIGVVLIISLCDIVLNFLGGARYSGGWYAGKLEQMIAHVVILAVLLAESGRLMLVVSDAERRTRSIIDGVADALITLDDQRRIASFNPAAQALFGYAASDVTGLAIEDVIPTFGETMKGRRGSPVVELSGRHATGRLFPLEIAFGEGSDRDRRRTIVIARDITQRKRAEHAIQSARDRAIESANVKSQFLATMSHEIRTPINAVVGMSELLLQSELNAEAREYATIVRDSAEALLVVINDILDFSKIEAGKMEIDARPFSLLSIVENAADLSAAIARSKGIRLDTYIADDVPAQVLGDGNRVRQILINLIGNAVKFTSTGSVLVRAEAAIEKGRSAVRFSVTDTGPGIADEDLGKLFEAFRQGDGSMRRRHGGTGLGLSISKRLVDMMDGEIGVESSFGAGSTFWFWLPFARAADEIPAQPVRSLRGKRVLIFEDDDSSRAVVEQYLLAWGLVATSAGNAAQAIALMTAAAARDAPFDVALLDDRGPGIDGFSLAARIRSEAAIAKTPLVLVSARSEMGLASEATARGFAGSVRKPIKQSALYEAIAFAVDGTRPEPALVPAGGTVLRDDVLVLIAEDNPVNRKLALTQLKKLGYRANAVENGAEAVRAVAATAYDLVLMDCQMPELDGFDAARTIRRAEEQTGARVPIVAMTANALEGDREACLAAGMDDYLAKPVQLAELRAVLERFTARGIHAG